MTSPVSAEARQHLETARRELSKAMGYLESGTIDVVENPVVGFQDKFSAAQTGVKCYEIAQALHGRLSEFIDSLPQ
jgi:hypothetical protein